MGGYIQVLPSFEFGNGGTSTTTTSTGNAPALLAVEASELKTDSSLVDKILSAISYKVKLGVDCEIIPQIVGTVAIAASGQLSGFKPPMKKPDAIIEVGIRYNF